MPPVISGHNVNVWYNGLHALKDASLEIAERQITAFIGASGSGKSTLLRCLNRMLDTIPTARATGEIFYRGQNVFAPDMDVMALRRRVGMVFQNPTPFPKSIYDNIAYGLELQGYVNRRRIGLLRRQPIDPQAMAASTDRLDRAVMQSLQDAALWDEVKDRLHKSALGLSGGQQQRLCIARSITVQPDVLLLDEPCSELDPISTRKIEDFLLALKRDYTIVIVTHNMHQARRISDETCFFHLGELIEQGPTGVTRSPATTSPARLGRFRSAPLLLLRG